MADPSSAGITGAGAPPRNLETVYAQTAAVGDQPASHDSLGFKLYVEALASFLRAPATRAPFTLSIEGAWGSGKSSFMLQLKNEITVKSPGAVAIDFNAWKYDKQEELWAAFALTVTRSLRRSTPLLRRGLGDVKLYVSRLKGLAETAGLVAKCLLWLTLALTFALGVRWSLQASYSERFAAAQKAIAETFSASEAERGSNSSSPPPFEPSAKGGASDAQQRGIANSGPNGQQGTPKASQPDHWLLFAIANSPWATGLIILVWVIRKFPGAAGKTLFEIDLEKYIDRPDYKGKAAFVDAFSEDFANAARAYAPKGPAKVFVFIDDLDRCEAPKAADLMQAINLMIGDGSPLFFVIGLDRARVASSVAFKFREIAPYLLAKSEPTAAASGSAIPGVAAVRAFGDEFLEKFIQISFRIPTSDSDQQAVEFINSLISAPAELVEKPMGPFSFFGRFAKKVEAASHSTSPTAESKYDRDPFRVEAGPESDRIRSILLSVREILGHNPRRIKAFLNRFRLSLYIASSQGLLDKDLNSGKAEVTPETLGKFIALTSVYPEILVESLVNPSLFRLLEFYLTWGEAKEGEKDYIESWLNKPGVRALVCPPKTLTVEWEEKCSLDGFPVSKFLRILPPIPAPSKREVETQIEDAPPASTPNAIEFNLTQATPSAPLATEIEFKLTQVITPSAPNSANPSQPADVTSESNGAGPPKIESFDIRQVPESGPEEAPAARTASAELRFSEPRDQDERPQGEEWEGVQDAQNSSRDMDSVLDDDGSGIPPRGPNVTGGTIRQIQ
jgi:KAP family P-loop domain